jgi:hypothetical protein
MFSICHTYFSFFFYFRLLMIKIIVIIILGFIIYYKLLNRPNKINLKRNELKEDFNLNCILEDRNNIVKNYDSDFFEKKSMLEAHIKNLNTNKVPKNIYSSKVLIPFNYADKLDNNVIYNLNIKKKNSILKNEKKYYGKIQPFNQKILTNNYNYNLDTFFKDHETPQKYKNNCKDTNLFDKDVCSIEKVTINLFGNRNNNKTYLYWNIPANCLDVEYLLLFYKTEEQTDKEYEFIKLDYIENSLTKKYKNVGKLDAYYNTDRLNYNFYFKYNDNYQAFIYLKYFKNSEVISNVFKIKN